jgi:hypothetical protein
VCAPWRCYAVPLSTAILIVINEPRGIARFSMCPPAQLYRGDTVYAYTQAHTDEPRIARAEMHNATISAEIRYEFDYRCPEFNIARMYVKTAKARRCTGTFIIGRYRFNVCARGATRCGVSIY